MAIFQLANKLILTSKTITYRLGVYGHTTVQVFLFIDCHVKGEGGNYVRSGVDWYIRTAARGAGARF